MPYIVAQVLGASWPRRVLYLIASGKRGLRSSARASPPTATASTRPAATRLLAALVTEVVMTFMFLIVILGATGKAPAGFAPIAIGLA